jgi:glycerophosphoryl diester phosphodiesterase
MMPGRAGLRLRRVMETNMNRKTLVALTLALCGPWVWALDLQGHRGARGLLPENTLPSFARALSIGVTTLDRKSVV